MNFEQTYEFYSQGGPSSHAGGSDQGYEQNVNYQAGMDSFGPQVGPSASARYDFESSVTRELSQLNARFQDFGDQQRQFSETLAHNTDLTQENWGMTTAMHHDISSIFSQLNLDPNDPNSYREW